MRPARSTVRLVAATLTALATGTLVGLPRAQTPTPVEKTTTTAPVGCVLTGKSHVGADVQIYDSQERGTAVARFTGGETPLRVDGFPTAASGGRARVRTAVGKGGFRIAGYVDSTKIPVFTKREVAVIPGHLWLGAHRGVQVLRGSSTRMEVQKELTVPLRQTFRAWGPCGAFALQAGTPPAWDVPGNARGWKAKNETLELFDGWKKGRSQVGKLERAKGMLFWSTKQRGGFVEVQYHGEIVISAWVSSTALKALPWGEREDVVIPPVRRTNSPRLKLAEVPDEVTTTKEVKIRSEPKESASIIGVIEPNTETYVLDEVVGWASVLPKSLHVAPAGDGQFWVLGSDLGLNE